VLYAYHQQHQNYLAAYNECKTGKELFEHDISCALKYKKAVAIQ
jgi:hypothetical protein